MGTFVKAANTSEFQGINKKKVEVQGEEIMLAKVGDSYYAIANRCAHMAGDLSAGTLEGTVITCPRHGSQFDITDGHNVRWLGGPGLVPALLKPFSSAKPVKSYKVKVEGDAVMVEV
ncbi:MAG: Rieske 2Fe-2S domain-containing protein [Dehalococcoidales bacterium]|jgi:3-phenylpropionate/trans-cinnamate dioxygenase ferredoxin subunit